MKIPSVTLAIVSGNMEDRLIFRNDLSFYKTEINQNVSFHEKII